MGISFQVSRSELDFFYNVARICGRQVKCPGRDGKCFLLAEKCFFLLTPTSKLEKTIKPDKLRPYVSMPAELGSVCAFLLLIFLLLHFFLSFYNAKTNSRKPTIAKTTNFQTP